MKTEQLIKALAADGTERSLDLSQRFAIALAVGFAFSAALFSYRLGLRPNFATVITHDGRLALKIVVTLALALAAGGLMMRLVRPAAAPGYWISALFVAPALLILGVAYELMAMPPATWMPRLVGRNAMTCLTNIPLMAAPLLVAFLLVMRSGAPLRPLQAGAVTGLAAGGLAAAMYAMHCPDDSPLFVATWYGIAIVAVTVVGALAGARWLRW